MKLKKKWRRRFAEDHEVLPERKASMLLQACKEPYRWP
jgi:hypothetical protein